MSDARSPQIDPNATKALGTINWLVTHPCGHPSQRFKVLARQPPCATCYGSSIWYGVREPERGGAFADWVGRALPVAKIPALSVPYARATLTVTSNGYTDVMHLWWPLHTEDEIAMAVRDG